MEQHKRWYNDNCAKYKAIEQRAKAGKDLSIKECDFMTWWDGYRLTCPDPDKLPRHSTMVVPTDCDPMDD
jgi:hypothetical protein